MVGFLQSDVALEEEKEDTKTQALSDSKKQSVSNDPLDLSLPELEDISLPFSDSFFDFDSINNWYMEGEPNMTADLGGNPVDFSTVGVVRDGLCEKIEVGEDLGVNEGSLWGLGQEKGETGVVDKSTEMGSDRVCEKIDVQGGLGCLIEQQLEKVTLDGVSDGSNQTVNLGGQNPTGGGVDCTDAGDVVGSNGNEMKIVKTEIEEDEIGSQTESEGESSSSASLSSSSSSSSSSSDEEEESSEEEEGGAMNGKQNPKNEKGIVDIEEGEIALSEADEMVAWSDNEDEDGSGSGAIGPITSKNELKVLPPVPSVSVTLQPHHQTQPIGIILSVIGPQVIVEGVEKHNPLNEGSILWISESRSPLGIIDEIFGPVKNPYYIVRYNAESEVPVGIQQGTLISFVPEFAQHVLNERSLYQKGYDASGENDEELTDEAEFSDDEKEAEYRRMLKIKKRGTNESKTGSKRKEKRQVRNQNGNWNRNRDPPTQTPLGADKLPVTNDQHIAPPVLTSLNQDNNSYSSGPSSTQASGPPFPPVPPNGLWNNGFPHQQHQGVSFPNGLPPNGMLWMQQNGPYQLYQTPLQPSLAFQQPINTIPGLPFNFNALGGQPNFGGNATFGSWPILNQNMMNPSQFGMAFQAQHASLPLNGGGEQAIQSQGSQISTNFQPPPANLNFNQGCGGGRGQEVQSQGSQISTNFQPSPSNMNFNQGRGGGQSEGSQSNKNFQPSPANSNFNQGRGGGRGHYRGRGRFGGGRGRYQSH